MEINGYGEMHNTNKIKLDLVRVHIQTGSDVITSFTYNPSPCTCGSKVSSCDDICDFARDLSERADAILSLICAISTENKKVTQTEHKILNMYIVPLFLSTDKGREFTSCLSLLVSPYPNLTCVCPFLSIGIFYSPN